MNHGDTLTKIRELDKEYWRKFLDNYPTVHYKKDKLFLQDSELCDLSLKVQTLLTMLGDKATARMMYLGFDLVYAFDNPVNWHSWASKIIDNNVDQSNYMTISTEIESEFKRMEYYLENSAWNVYNDLPTELFIDYKSKTKYKDLFKKQ